MLTRVISKKVCTQPLVSHMALVGAPRALAWASQAGAAPSRAAMYSVSLDSISHDSKAPDSEISSPRLISAAPVGPMTCASTWAMDGFLSTASSGCVITPSENRLTLTINASVNRKPSKVARPTSTRRSARAEHTLAPSTPMNTHTVTSIMLRTWSVTLPSAGLAWPQMSCVNTSVRNASPTSSTNSASGTSLATVVTWLMKAASRMPRSTRKCMPHSMTDALATATGVLPSPNTGR